MAGYNANIAFPQGGDSLNLGGTNARKGTVLLNWEEIMTRLLNSGHPGYVGYWDDFEGDTLKAEWDTESGTIALPTDGGEVNGILPLITAATGGEYATLALGLHYKPSSTDWMYFVARVAPITSLTSGEIEIGISDAVAEPGGGQAFSSHDATPVAVASDAVIMALDASESISTWSCLSVNDGGTPQRTDSEVAATADTYQKLAILIDPDGTAHFYIDDVWVAAHEDAVNSVGLTPWVTVRTEYAGAKTLKVDYVGISTKRG